MPDRAQRLTIANLTGGRNAVDAPSSPSFGDTQAAEMVNVDFFKTTFANRRNGTVTTGMTFSSGGPFTDKIDSLFYFVPGTDETVSEEWAIDATGVWGRKAAATTFAQVTPFSNISGSKWLCDAAGVDGKLFFAYNSGVSRLHCWDGTTHRRAGLPAPAAPTAANTGAGAYAATLRYYRQRWTTQSAGVTVRRSEPSPSVSFTPSGAGTAARVTKAANAGESETHWEVEASADNTTFYLIATTAIATTTYDDSAAVSSYPTNTVSAATGTYTVQKAYKYIATDQNRLLGFGSWVSTDKQNRVEFSAVLGSLDIGDVERVNTTVASYVDLDENDSGDPTGLVGPVFGNFYAFKTKQFWELRATGDVNRPYQATAVSKTIGAVSHRAYCRGEDAQGEACIYFMSNRGMYRYGVGGLQYIGYGISDLTNGTDFTNFTDRILLTASIICHMVYYAEKAQVWVWWATGNTGGAVPNTLGVFHVRTGGWTRYLTDGATDKIAKARCSCMLPRSFGATMSRDLKPHFSTDTATNNVHQGDADATTDGGTTFRAYTRTRLYQPWGSGFAGHTGDARLLADTASVSTTITLRAARDGIQATTDYREGTADVNKVGSEVLASRRIEGVGIAQGEYVQFTVGDAAAASTAWRLHALTVPYERDEALGA